ncbi:hypothetical protein EPUL_001886 [Erysiphe pulchra]|uniref:Uncharacterized protein n=1 Tax=Erysiphe pulchra TaxID=225359 RepID=A0A2S4Q098_9PEZI|nr:hypothetical protein EPUL_001886 [Erysiphe pulchra]
MLWRGLPDISGQCFEHQLAQSLVEILFLKRGARLAGSTVHNLPHPWNNESQIWVPDQVTWEQMLRMEKSDPPATFRSNLWHVITYDIIEAMEIQIEPTAGKTSMSALHLSRGSELVKLNEKTEIMASSGVKENFRLASNDLDYPGPSENLSDEPLCYNDPPPLAGPIEDELNNTTDDAAQRVTEVKLKFGSIASILDYYSSQATSPHMLVKQDIALKDFSDEILLVAKRHFEAYVKDNKFSVCPLPKTGESAALKEEISSTSLLSNVIIENAPLWISYRIQIVPRNYDTLTEDLEHQLIPDTTMALSDALTAAIGITPISIIPSQENDTSPKTSSTSWIVRFSEAL